MFSTVLVEAAAAIWQAASVAATVDQVEVAAQLRAETTPGMPDYQVKEITAVTVRPSSLAAVVAVVALALLVLIAPVGMSVARVEPGQVRQLPEHLWDGLAAVAAVETLEMGRLPTVVVRLPQGAQIQAVVAVADTTPMHMQAAPA